jgi:serine/threonine protein kinase
LDGRPIIVADFVSGLTLRDLVRDRPPTFREAADLVAGLADALDYAQAVGLVHRDVKPSNIMVEPPAGPAAPRQQLLRPVVARKDDDGVVGNSQVADRVEDLAGAMVEFGEAVREVAGAGSAVEIGMRQGGVVHLREWHVSEERLTFLHVAVHEVDAPPRDSRVDPPPGLEVVDFDLPRLTSLLTFQGCRGSERPWGRTRPRPATA